MRFLAVDDERIGLCVLRDAIIKAEPDAEIGAFQNASEALQYMEENEIDVAFLDIELGIMSGIDLAKKIKVRYPKINVIFCTGYSEYQREAIKMHASGYLLKPITAEDVAEELKNLLYPVEREKRTKLYFQCFGNFEVFADGKQLHFKMEKTKEVLAYLVDREGAMVNNSEIIAAIWEDDKDHRSYFQNLQSDLKNTLKEAGYSNVIVNSWGKLGILKDNVECDYYDWKSGRLAGINAYRGEYMAQYSWSEFTNGALL